MKKAIGALLAAVLTLSCVGCNNTTPPPAELETLNAPFNIKVSDEGVITWVGDVNATDYIVTVDGVEHTVSNPYFYLDTTTSDISFTIVARADGYNDSQPASGQYSKPTVTVGIKGNSEIRPGGRTLLTALVTNAKNGVEWEIIDGKEYATINQNGMLTAAGDDKITSDRLVTVKATSKEDPTASARKTVTVTARTELTQAMLDELQSDTVAFEGYVNIDLYTFGINRKFYRNFTSDVKTAMDGTHWYTEFSDANTGISTSLFYENHNGVASQVSVSFMNEESYVPMLDGETPVTWEDSGLYNNFKGLTVDDFEFNETTWRWEYSGDDDKLIQRMVASANPYDFVPTNLALIIADGHVAGIYSKAETDFTLVEQYDAEQELIVVVNVGDTVGKVPTISKFEHAEIHDKLTAAVENMKSLDSYTVDFLNIGGSSFTSGYTLSGFTETVTDDVCHFRAFEQNSYGSGDSVIRNYTGDDYGYVNRSDASGDLYNAYSISRQDGEEKYSANRAYAADFANAKPSFAFAAEIFNSYYENEKDGTTTFYANDVMTSVASTFYYGVGNDVALYGLYAAIGSTSDNSTFTPYVTVKDGYIVDAAFYYYLGYMYGVVELKYSDFNEASVDESVLNSLATLETRQVPTSWDQVDIITTPDSSDTEHVENGLVYLKNFFGSAGAPDNNIADKLPFFAEAIGDTYGFGLTTYKLPPDSVIMVQMIIFYYDVPLDLNYSIDSSMAALKDLLIANGYEKDKNDVFTKENVAVQIVDSSLDLNIYVWKNTKTSI